MKSTQFISTVLFLFLLTLSSCQLDDGNYYNQDQQNIPEVFSQYFGNEISRDFIGTVIDKSNLPISGVTITIGNDTAQTDGNGIFIIRDANVNERFGYVRAQKVGYINGSRSLVPAEGTNKVTIMLLEANVTATINSGSSETVSLTNGSSVSFDGNFIKENGDAYSGAVNVIMHHLDPTDVAMPLQMPGMLYAENEEGAERMLQTLGMLAVELRGTNGEDLNLPEGSTSEIKIPVDASLMSMAPTSIPLWYFDEVNGYWKEEGQATLQGNMYVGTVRHFSFWNCDIPAEAITICITATDDEENTLGNLWVSITSGTFGTTYGYTNENGEVCGFVPSNETLELNVYSYDFCGETPIFTESIGPFTMDSENSIIIPDNPDVIAETVIGNFSTCDDNPVTDGYVQLNYRGQTFTDIVSDGAFEINMLRCTDDNTFHIEGSDFVNLQSTDSIGYTFTTPLTNIGTISACNAITEFIQYTIDDGDSVYLVDNISANFYNESPNTTGPTLDIFASGNDQTTCFYLFSRLDETNYEGTYDYLDWNNPNDTGFNIEECIGISNTNNNIIYNLTSLGVVGEYIDINFSGSYEDFNNQTHTITGIIHVLRDQ